MAPQSTNQILKDILKTLKRIEQKIGGSGTPSSQPTSQQGSPSGPGGTIGNHIIAQARTEVMVEILTAVNENGQLELDSVSHISRDFDTEEEEVLEDLQCLHDRGVIRIEG